ncbi:MAG: hypothetical protein BGO09_14670 [Bacteroidetes bacterium 47-18]|nr:MAG: hypothetical protein BGO09_14670 [Bacteroidetes bacterium 47-18]
MKRILIASIVCLLVVSCDPKDMPTEDITLPDIEFAFTVNPDTAYLKVGDTFAIRAAISSKLSNGVQLTDGGGEIWFSAVRGENIPRISFDDISPALNNEDYNLIIENGAVKWMSSNPNQLYRLTFFPTGDSIILHYKFVFLKKGLYQIGGFQSSFYQGSKGKARTKTYFNVANHNWNLVDMPENPVPKPGEYGYSENYLFAVTD